MEVINHHHHYIIIIININIIIIITTIINIMLSSSSSSLSSYQYQATFHHHTAGKSLVNLRIKCLHSSDVIGVRSGPPTLSTHHKIHTHKFSSSSISSSIIKIIIFYHHHHHHHHHSYCCCRCYFMIVIKGVYSKRRHLPLITEGFFLQQPYPSLRRVIDQRQTRRDFYGMDFVFGNVTQMHLQ